MGDEAYATIRDILGWAIGRRIVEITQHDKEEWESEGACYIMVMLDDGNYIQFNIGDEGFAYSEDGVDDES